MILFNHKGATWGPVAPRALVAAVSLTQAWSVLLGTGVGSLQSHSVPPQVQLILGSPVPQPQLHKLLRKLREDFPSQAENSLLTWEIKALAGC